MASLVIRAYLSPAAAVAVAATTCGSIALRPTADELSALSAAERDALASYASTSDDSSGNRLHVATPDWGGVLAAIRRETTERAERETTEREARNEREAAAREHAEAAMAAWPLDRDGLPDTHRDHPHPEGYYYSHYSDYKVAYNAVPGIGEARAAASALRAKLIAERVAAWRALPLLERAHALDQLASAVRDALTYAERREAMETMEAAQRTERERPMREWANTHGSELLRARIAGGFNWLALAEREWADAAVAPLGEQAKEGDRWWADDTADRTTPSLAEIRWFDEFRKLVVAAVPTATVSLKWLTYRDDDENDDEEHVVCKRSEALVTVTAPTGREFEFWYAAPAPEAEADANATAD